MCCFNELCVCVLANHNQQLIFHKSFLLLHHLYYLPLFSLLVFISPSWSYNLINLSAPPFSLSFIPHFYYNSSLFLPLDEIFMVIHTGCVGAAVGATGVKAFKDFMPLSLWRGGEGGCQCRRKGEGRWNVRGGMKKETHR